MNGFLFPTSFIPLDAARFIHAFTGRFSVLLPVGPDFSPFAKDLEEAGLAHCLAPLSGETDARELSRILDQTDAWGGFFPDADAKRLAASGGETPAFDQTAGSAILENLRKKIGGKDAPPETDEVLKAQVFAAMAEKLDRTQWEAASTLAGLKDKQKTLAQALSGKETGGKEGPRFPVGVPDEAADLQMDARMKSFATLLAALGRPVSFLITTSQAALDWLELKNPDMAFLARGDGMTNPGAPDEFPGILETLLEGDLQAAVPSLEAFFQARATGKGPGLAVYAVPEKSPSQALGLPRPEAGEPGVTVVLGFRFPPV